MRASASRSRLRFATARHSAKFSDRLPERSMLRTTSLIFSTERLRWQSARQASRPSRRASTARRSAAAAAAASDHELKASRTMALSRRPPSGAITRRTKASCSIFCFHWRKPLASCRPLTRPLFTRAWAWAARSSRICEVQRSQYFILRFPVKMPSTFRSLCSFLVFSTLFLSTWPDAFTWRSLNSCSN